MWHNLMQDIGTLHLAHTVSYSKATRRETEHKFLSSVEVKKQWRYASTCAHEKVCLFFFLGKCRCAVVFKLLIEKEDQKETMFRLPGVCTRLE
jgi:hypothetical protein